MVVVNVRVKNETGGDIDNRTDTDVEETRDPSVLRSRRYMSSSSG